MTGPEPELRPSPQENLDIVLRECVGLPDYTRLCTVLAGYAESDYRSGAVQRSTIGVFQQDPRWWPSATLDTAHQARAFIADFQRNSRLHNGDPVHDCWITQRWTVPAADWPDPGPGWRDAPESQNYVRRLPLISTIISERRLP